jgi:hypothetical protein
MSGGGARCHTQPGHVFAWMVIAPRGSRSHWAYTGPPPVIYERRYAVTIQEQAENLERSLHTLERMKSKPWLSAEDRRVVVEDLRPRIRTAEATLNLPARPDEASGRQKLILWHEMAVGTLKSPEYQ